MKAHYWITITLLCLAACGKEVERVVYVIPESHSTPSNSDNDNDDNNIEECNNDRQQQQQQRQTSASEIRECVWSGINISRQ